METNVLKKTDFSRKIKLFIILFLTGFWMMNAQTGLIGMAQLGGTGSGTSFNIDLTSGLFNSTPFNGSTNGAAPNGSYFKASDGNIYGMVTYNSYGFFVFGNGYLVKYNPNVGSITPMFQFSGTSGPYPGGRAQGGLIEANPGVLYGMTYSGGTNNEGVIFSYTLSSNTYSVLYNFNSTTGGYKPQGTLLKGSDGLLYGLTGAGGSTGDGTMFSFNLSTNVYTTLFSFTGSSGSNPGSTPAGHLIEPTNGIMYGLTPYGGANGDGVLFQYNIATTTYSVKYNFSSASGGYNPEGSLVKATNGKLYGLAGNGGTLGFGTMFEYNTAGAGTYSTLVNFSGTSTPAMGAYPKGSLMQATNGSLYGMTFNGGATNDGVIFGYNLTSSTYTVLTSFSGFSSGAPGSKPTHGHLIEVSGLCPYPSVSSVQITDVNCYGGNDGTATVTAVSGGTISYNWLPSGGTSSAASNLTAGIYTCAITNACGTTNETLTVNEPPALFVTASANNTLICTGNASTLTASAGGGMGIISFTWTGGSNNYTAVVNPASTSVYTVNIDDSNGCTQSATVMVTVGSGTIPVISVNNGTICAGQSFTITPSGAATYTIQGGSNVVSPTSNTSYTVIGTSSQGCVSNSAATSSVVVNALPTVSATSNSSLLCTGQTATLTAGGANTYVWSTTSTNTSIAVSPTVTTSYTVTGSTNGCTNTAVITQSVSTCTGIEKIGTSNSFNVYPNPFGSLLHIELTNAGGDEKVSIYNTLGTLVYEGKLKESKTVVDLSSLPNGIYFVKLGNTTRKLVKE